MIQYGLTLQFFSISAVYRKAIYSILLFIKVEPGCQLKYMLQNLFLLVFGISEFVSKYMFFWKSFTLFLSQYQRHFDNFFCCLDPDLAELILFLVYD